MEMVEDTKISDHLAILSCIVSELKVIGTKIKDEGETLQFIWTLPSSYEHMKPIIMYEKETSDFVEVISELLSEERSLNNEGVLPKRIFFLYP